MDVWAEHVGQIVVVEIDGSRGPAGFVANMIKTERVGWMISSCNENGKRWQVG